MNTVQIIYQELLEASQNRETLEAYLEYHTGRESAKHIISYSTGDWLGAVFTMDNGVTINTLPGNLTYSTATTVEVRWIENLQLETMLDDIFRDIWESGNVDPLDIIEEFYRKEHRHEVDRK